MIRNWLEKNKEFLRLEQDGVSGTWSCNLMIRIGIEKNNKSRVGFSGGNSKEGTKKIY